MALSPGRRTAVAGALVLAVAWAYAPLPDHAWLNYDDDLYLTANPALRQGLGADGLRWAFTTLHGANWFPLTWVSWLADYQIHGLEARGFLLTNLCLHAGSTALLFLAFARMTGHVGRSALTAAVFALHPLHVESVAWASARKDTLSGLFFALCLWIHAGGGRGPRSPARGAATAAALTAGLMAKPSLVTLPFVLLLLDAWPLRRIVDGEGRLDRAALRRALLEKIPLFALAAASSVMTLVAQGRAGVVADLAELSGGERAANALLSYAVYLRQAFWPRDLAVFYPHPEGQLGAATLAAAAALLLGISAAAVAARRRAPYLTVGWLWYLGVLVPMIGLVQVGSQAHADRYTYLPLIGIALAVAWGVPALTARGLPGMARRALLAAGGVVVVGALGLATRQQLSTWRDSEALMRHALTVTRENPVAHAHLGSALLERGLAEETAHHWRRAAELDPQSLHVANNLAWLLATHPDPELRRPGEAVRLAQRAVERAPGDPQVLDTLAAAHAADGRFDLALRVSHEALSAARAAGLPDLRVAIRERRRLYRERLPYVETTEPVR